MGDRFGFSPYPTGWFQIGWSDELPRGAVRPLAAFGRQLVLFRGKDGAAHLLDSTCPHLGANLAVGGEVVGTQLRCPFHGWRFDGAGACTHIDYAKKIPARARVESFRVHEQQGLLFAWHDLDGGPPRYTLPALPEAASADWSAPTRYAFTIKTRWREIVENAVDRGHFFALHRYPHAPELSFHTDGHRFDMKSQVAWRRFGRDLTVRLDIASHGPGYAVTRGDADLPFLVEGGPLPIDEDTVVHRLTFRVRKKLPWPLSAAAQRLMVHFALEEFRRDIPIWENKRTLERPVLCDGDGPIPRFRAWAAQFEPRAGATS